MTNKIIRISYSEKEPIITDGNKIEFCNFFNLDNVEATINADIFFKCMELLTPELPNSTLVEFITGTTKINNDAKIYN